MHYGDDKQAGLNVLEVVIYKHGGYKDKRKYELELTSIQNAKYVNPTTLGTLIQSTENHFRNGTIPPLFQPHFDDKEEEHWFLVSMKEGQDSEWSVGSIVDVSNEDDELLRLH